MVFSYKFKNLNPDYGINQNHVASLVPLCNHNLYLTPIDPPIEINPFFADSALIL